MKKLNKEELAQFVMMRHDTLCHKRASWLTLWQEIADYCMPRKAEITTSASEPGTSRETQLFDGTMAQANIILANGCMSYLSPSDARWFGFDPPEQLKGLDVVEQWYRHCSEIASAEMARSNFYSEIHELYLDRGAFGTAAIHCEEGRNSLLNFRKFDIGSYAIAEDDEGYVDTLTRELNLTARQAVQWFGAENVAESVRKNFESGQPQLMEQEFPFVHQIFPRLADEIEFGKHDPQNMPIASIYLDKTAKHVCRISGYREQPFFCTRFLRWNARHAYGFSPGWASLPDARQLNFLQKQLDALAELLAFPRVLIPDTHEDEIDLRASGVTYYDANNPNALPREWATAGRYEAGVERVKSKHESINQAFHVDMFQMFAQLDRPQMTAREVSERANEKLIQFSPTFSRLTTELYTPLLRRTFGILIRAGKFPPPPKEALVMDPAGGASLPEPQVSFSSKIALAIKSLENTSLMAVLETWLPLYQLKPEIFDNFAWDAAFRDSVRNAGLPQRWLVDLKVVEDMRKQRALEQQKREQQAEQMAMADAAGKVGSIKQDSAIAGMLQGMANGGR